MRQFSLPLLAVAALSLGGCATAGYGNDPLGGLLGGIFGNNSNDRNLDRLERAAVQRCGDEASRYGRVQITDVRRDGRDIVLVYGRIETRDRNRDQFQCAYRSDGRILDFDLD